MSMINYLKFQRKEKKYLNNLIHIQFGFSNTSLCVYISKLFWSLFFHPSMLFILFHNHLNSTVYMPDVVQSTLPILTKLVIVLVNS